MQNHGYAEHFRQPCEKPFPRDASFHRNMQVKEIGFAQRPEPDDFQRRIEQQKGRPNDVAHTAQVECRHGRVVARLIPEFVDVANELARATLFATWTSDKDMSSRQFELA